MSIGNRILSGLREELMAHVSQGYMFGSALDVKDSADIDLLLVYSKNDVDVAEVAHRLRKLEDDWAERLYGIKLDIVVLSEQEMDETRMLDRVGRVRRFI